MHRDGAAPGGAVSGDAPEVGRRFPEAAIVLAGGAGTRLGGVDKAALVLRGRSLLQAMLELLSGVATVVVGPPRPLPVEVASVQEQPAGGGPAAGVAAGWYEIERWLAPGSRPIGSAGTGPASVSRPCEGSYGLTDGVRGVDIGADVLIAVLAVDQPGLNRRTLARLAAAVAADGERRGAVLVHDGHRQYAAGVFPAGGLGRAVRGEADWHGRSLRTLLDPLIGAEVAADDDEAHDLDTPADLRWWRGRRDDGDSR